MNTPIRYLARPPFNPPSDPTQRLDADAPHARAAWTWMRGLGFTAAELDAEAVDPLAPADSIRPLSVAAPWHLARAPVVLVRTRGAQWGTQIPSHGEAAAWGRLEPLSKTWRRQSPDAYVPQASVDRLRRRPAQRVRVAVCPDPLEALAVEALCGGVLPVVPVVVDHPQPPPRPYCFPPTIAPAAVAWLTSGGFTEWTQTNAEIERVDLIGHGWLQRLRDARLDGASPRRPAYAGRAALAAMLDLHTDPTSPRNETP